MGIYSKLADDIQEVDVIIAGGGTAACTLAGRLADSDPGLSILVIEGGTNNRDVPSVVHPAFFLDHLAPDSKTAIFYQGKKSDKLAGRSPIVPAGGILGGGSSINFMLYARAQKSDYDSWRTPGWSADDLRPYLNRFETYHGNGDPSHHGDSGPVHISSGGFRVKDAEDDILAAAKQTGYPEIRDLQNLDTNNGYERWMRYVSPEGRRQDAAHTFLHPRLEDGKHPNLHVVVESKVIRVLFDDNKRAIGVEYTPNPQYQAVLSTTKHPVQTVRARKMVVLSCGACGTPSVLERSGLGDKKVLDKAGVPVVADLPGVGHDYQDHHLLLYPYKTALKPEETLDDILSRRISHEEAIERKHKMLGWNGVDIVSKIRPSEEEVKALGPEFEKAWEKDFKNDPNRPLMLSGFLHGYLGDHSAIPQGQYTTAANYTAYPYSRGSIHITGPSLEDPVDFDTGFFNDPDDLDLKKQVWAYKHSREVTRRTALYRGEVAGGHPSFPAGSKAALVDSVSPGAHKNVTPLEYSEADNKAIEQFLRENVNTTWHSLGTAKMAPREELGVVDSSLSVYGVDGLKVVDLSIVPENVAANTNNTAFVVGEKAADIIANELGLSVPPKL
ncbi:GMC oxidoreductase [Colletotrichum graminicola]|uniref:GMC oxidoreductase n=1 Tax=Colletotrichum graminicola (strain M1.001 / M2 / FGSC 10212) TaxID=645133 RepID=E3Q586_COLGM|nr:GMC oxidoreductase [Colletotrichum graminicola M1.001]EFQ25853.1 GMC oxidoreductase [Colletotrichum graminicola M1.001]WDK22965.1 GMC oxidoreductase [Colletotrichum graminicola]